MDRPPAGPQPGERRDLRTVQRRSTGGPARGTSRTVEGRAGARGRASRDGRIGPPGGPRTWPRCCDPWEAMVPVQAGLARPQRARSRIFADASGASAPRASARSISRRGRGDVQVQRRRGVARAASRGGPRSVPTSPRVIGPVRAARMPERPGVAQRPLDERAVDRQRAGLVEAGHPAELGDRVEQGDEPAGGQDGGGVVGRLRARARGGPAARRSPRPSRPASPPAGRRPRWRPSRRGARRPPAPCRRTRPADGTRRSGCRPPSPGRGPPRRARRWCGPSPGRCTSGASRPAARRRRRGRPG